jgi:hypothetical protein
LIASRTTSAIFKWFSWATRSNARRSDFVMNDQILTVDGSPSTRGRRPRRGGRVAEFSGMVAGRRQVTR